MLLLIILLLSLLQQHMPQPSVAICTQRSNPLCVLAPASFHRRVCCATHVHLVCLKLIKLWFYCKLWLQIAAELCTRHANPSTPAPDLISMVYAGACCQAGTPCLSAALQTLQQTHSADLAQCSTAQLTQAAWVAGTLATSLSAAGATNGGHEPCNISALVTKLAQIAANRLREGALPYTIGSEAACTQAICNTDCIVCDKQPCWAVPDVCVSRNIARSLAWSLLHLRAADTSCVMQGEQMYRASASAARRHGPSSRRPHGAAESSTRLWHQQWQVAGSDCSHMRRSQQLPAKWLGCLRAALPRVPGSHA